MTSIAEGHQIKDQTIPHDLKEAMTLSSLFPVVFVVSFCQAKV
jgi:hypothetical protein